MKSLVLHNWLYILLALVLLALAAWFFLARRRSGGGPAAGETGATDPAPAKSAEQDAAADVSTPETTEAGTPAANDDTDAPSAAGAETPAPDAGAGEGETADTAAGRTEQVPAVELDGATVGADSPEVAAAVVASSSDAGDGSSPEAVVSSGAPDGPTGGTTREDGEATATAVAEPATATAVAEPATATATATVTEPAVTEAGAEPAAAEPTTGAESTVEPHPKFGPRSGKPLPDGGAPSDEFVIKGNVGSKLYHTTASPYFTRMKAGVWFRSEHDAQEAGFTAWNQRRKG